VRFQLSVVSSWFSKVRRSAKVDFEMMYVLYGSDSFSRSEALSAIKAELDVNAMLSPNTTRLDARQAAPQDVFAVCDTLSMFGERRLVVLEGALSQAAGRTGGRQSKRKPAEAAIERSPWWALVDYAPRMPEQTVLVLDDGENIDRELLKALEPVADVRRKSLPMQKEIAAWVQSRARTTGLTIEGRACSLLAELVGTDTWMLASELDKLAAYASGKAISETDVRVLVTDVREREGYLLADAVADGKAAAATKVLHDLLAKGRPPAVLLLTIENRYRRIAAAREMVDRGENGRNIAARLRIENPYALERLLDQVSRYPMPRVIWALDRIAQADYDVKQGIIDQEELSLELVVHDLSAPAPASQAP
jgi:DNA polymerase-3 subunit delta